MFLLNFLPAFLLVVLGVLTPLFKLGQVVVQSWQVSWERLASDWIVSAIKFTLWQAGLSAFISVCFGLLLALVLANRLWPLRRALLVLSSLPFALPSVLVAFAFVLAFGRSGFVASVSGLELGILYTPAAVVAAHVFFNLPLAMRHLVDAVESVPKEHVRSARLLNLSPLATFRHVLWPHISTTVFSLFVLVFILCLSSFAIVLLLGGGPQATTLEVAVYQLLRFEAEPASAALVASAQLLCLVPVAFLYRKLTAGIRERSFVSLGESEISRARNESWTFRVLGGFLIALYALFILLPLVGLSIDAFKGVVGSALFVFQSHFLSAVAGSVSLAIPAAAICVLASWMFARGIAAIQDTNPRVAGLLGDAVWLMMGLSPTALTLAWIVMLSATDFDVYGNPYPIILFVHVLLALPICSRTLLPVAVQLHRRFERSALSIGVLGWMRMRYVEWPEMRGALLSAFLLAFAFSFGDVSCVLMFGAGHFSTLPVYIFELMGAYRFGAAAVASVLLAIICVGFFWVAETRFRARRISL